LIQTRTRFFGPLGLRNFEAKNQENPDSNSIALYFISKLLGEKWKKVKALGFCWGVDFLTGADTQHATRSTGSGKSEECENGQTKNY
jgi:hypothetical protein